MPLRVSCQSCGKTLVAPDHAAGRRARCPNCRAVLTIPRPADDPDAEVGRAMGDKDIRKEHGKPHVPESQVPAQPAPVLGDQTALPDWLPKLRRYGYLFFMLALLPLAFSLLNNSTSDVFWRSEHSIAEYEETHGKFADDVSFDDILFALPGKRIQGAHLAADSGVHWFYALLSGGLFMAAAMLLFDPGSAKFKNLIWVGLFTGTVGIFLLLSFHSLAVWSQGYEFEGGSELAILFYIVQFIGYAYHAADDPTNGFWRSAFGFTLSVGLCEETVKAMPVMWRVTRKAWLDWRGACAWGLVSGVGFGVAEGISYSEDYYNGIHTGGIYIVRFVSCVGLHAVWGASIGLSVMLILKKGRPGDFFVWVFVFIRAMWLPMVLHGLYDTMLKQEMNAEALLTALVSFGWLAYLVERSTRRDLADARDGRVQVS